MPKKFWLQLVFGLVVFLGMGFYFSISNTAKAELLLSVDRTYTMGQGETDGKMQVNENENLKNNFSNLFLPANQERKYQFVISQRDAAKREEIANSIYFTLAVTHNGKAANITKFKEGENYGFSYRLARNLGPGESVITKISYLHPELGERTGGVLDAYVPAFSKDYKFKTDSQEYKYSTKVKIPKNAGQESVVSIPPATRGTEDEYDTYTYNTDQLVGKTLWIQRGNKQVYKFEIDQQVVSTDTEDTGNLYEYQMVLPRDIEELNVRQKVYYSSIEPAPISINQDSEGNMIGTFRMPAQENAVIKLSGYAEVSYKDKQDFSSTGTLADYPTVLANYSKYTKPAEYWEVSNSAINKVAEEIVGQNQNVSEIMNLTYSYVVSKIDYSDIQKFGLNERKGALRTLTEGSGVCMEYSDLYLTLLRNRKVATRAAFGYGYDSRTASDKQEAHQWVQVFLPSSEEWMSVDVTWGESGNKVIGGDLNHFYTHVAADNPNTPAIFSRKALGSVGDELASPQFKIEVLAEIPSTELDSLISVATLIETYPPTANSSLEFLKDFVEHKLSRTLTLLTTTPTKIDQQGWILLAVLICILFIASSTIFSILKFIYNSVFAKRKTNQPNVSYTMAVHRDEVHGKKEDTTEV